MQDDGAAEFNHSDPDTMLVSSNNHKYVWAFDRTDGEDGSRNVNIVAWIIFSILHTSYNDG